MNELDPRQGPVTVVIPTYNEAANIAELVERLGRTLTAATCREVIFVDDSTDGTPEVIAQAATWSALPLRCIHRELPVGGLSGAVVDGLRAATGEWVVVMDADLQHPPELITALLATGQRASADVVVASRHVEGGDSAGLAGPVRKLVSGAATALARTLFPRRLRHCTDPMTGFFAVRRAAVDVDVLRPRGFKILLELLCSHTLAVVEHPLQFADRAAGESKADAAQGFRFVQQLAALRFGRISRFALVGGVGALANVAIMGLLMAWGVNYLWAAGIAAAITIVTNFIGQELLVFRERRRASRALWQRCLASLSFNAAEAALRLPLLFVLASGAHINAVLAQALTLIAAFALRYTFMNTVVYRRRPAPVPLSPASPASSTSSASPRLTPANSL